MVGACGWLCCSHELVLGGSRGVPETIQTFPLAPPPPDRGLDSACLCLSDSPPWGGRDLSSCLVLSRDSPLGESQDSPHNATHMHFHYRIANEGASISVGFCVCVCMSCGCQEVRGESPPKRGEIPATIAYGPW